MSLCPVSPTSTSTISVARLTAALLGLVGVAALAAFAASASIPQSATLHPPLLSLPSSSYSFTRYTLLFFLSISTANLYLSRLDRLYLLHPPSLSNPRYFFLWSVIRPTLLVEARSPLHQPIHPRSFRFQRCPFTACIGSEAMCPFSSSFWPLYCKRRPSTPTVRFSSARLSPGVLELRRVRRPLQVLPPAQHRLPVPRPGRQPQPSLQQPHRPLRRLQPAISQGRPHPTLRQRRMPLLLSLRPPRRQLPQHHLQIVQPHDQVLLPQRSHCRERVALLRMARPAEGVRLQPPRSRQCLVLLSRSSQQLSPSAVAVRFPTC